MHLAAASSAAMVLGTVPALASGGSSPSTPAADACWLLANGVFEQAAAADARALGRCLARGSDLASCLGAATPPDKDAGGCEAFAPEIPDVITARRAAAEGATALIGGIYDDPPSVSPEGKQSPEGFCQTFAFAGAGACWVEQIARFNRCKAEALQTDPADLDACLDLGPDARLAGACGNALEGSVEAGCEQVDVSGLFAGCGASNLDSLTSCLRARAACQACSSLAALDGLSADCDVADDGLPNGSCGPAEGPAAHLRILAAGIAELAPIDPENVAARGVSLRLELAGMPRCDASAGSLAYGFLVDADRDASTGSDLPAFDALGIDARLSAVCDPATGEFSSPLGPVTLGTDPDSGRAILEIRSVVLALPSVDFQWIAFASQDGSLSRLPPAPWHWAWTTHERALF